MKKLVIFDFAGTIDSPREIGDALMEAIKNLSPKYILAIVSSTSSSYIKEYLKNENVLSDFSEILGSDILLTKLDRIKNLLEKYNLNPEDAVYITDTLGDILEAKRLNIKSIGVSWGLNEREILEKGNPSIIIDDPRLLLSAIQDVLK